MPLLIAFLPAAFFGVLLDSVIESALMHPLPVIIALAAGGVIMIVVGRGPRRKSDGDGPNDVTELSLRAALLIGLIQCLAMIPGHEPLDGHDRRRHALRSPAGAGGRVQFPARPPHARRRVRLQVVGQPLSGEGPNLFETLGVLPIIIGLITATAAAGLAIAWLVAYLNRHGLAAFGWYRIGLAIVMFVVILN